MKKNGKEFEDLRKQFEVDLKKMGIYVSLRLDREPRDSHYYYENGEVNNLFIAYMNGYQLAKSLARIDALPLEG
jgi:hypothetical protein